MPNLSLKWVVLAVNVLCVMTLAFNTTAMMNAIPSIQSELMMSPSLSRWVVNSYILCGAAFILLGGCLGDFFGPFRVLFFALLIFGLTSLSMAVCSSSLVMVGLRSLQGTAAAVISAVALSSISSVFPLAQRAFAITIWGGMVGLGFGLGPLLGGALTTLVGWRYLFVVIASVMWIGILGNGIFWRVYPHISQKGSLDFKGAFFLMGWMGALVFLIMEGQHIGWTSPLMLGTAIVCIAMLILCVRHMCIEPFPLISLSLFKQPQLIGSVALFFITLFSLIAFLFFYNRFLQWPALHHASAFQAGLWILPMNLAMCITALFASKIARRVGNGAALMLGMFLLTIGFGWFACFPHHQIDWMQKSFLIVMGGGFGLAFPLAPYVGLQALPQSEQGKGSGIINTANYLGGCLAISLGSVIYLQASCSYLEGCDAQTRDVLLMGSEKEIFNLALDPTFKASLEQAGCHSFSILMAVLAAMCCIGVVMCKCFVKSKIDCASKIE
ncbi:MAG: MFS transporter [Verrucomicrobia bacterium]|nr:MFS transporter [Verrucomicrobiota bacterium]MBS0647128.1 MFS transporter [Verrucomicrobiota bacterium]